MPLAVLAFALSAAVKCFAETFSFHLRLRTALLCLFVRIGFDQQIHKKMPPKAKYLKKKATAPTKQEKLLHPLKPRNAEGNVGVQSNAAKLFAAIAAKQCTVVKTVVENPAPNQLNECKAMLLKPEPADDPTDILSSVSSSNSLSVNIQFADIMKKLESIENNVQEMGKHQAKCSILGAQANAKIDYTAKQPTVNVAGKPQESLLVPVNSLTDLENAEKRCEDDSYVEMGQMHGKKSI
ncbi:hypothetical protein RP20_CCG022073 [Aedes albopictus]|nr:hypothetical protein RP20_CCG022073 [Aedes albopictus]